MSNLTPDVRILAPHRLFFYGKQRRLIDAGFTPIHVYKGSRWEMNSVRRFLKETRPLEDWHVASFKTERSWTNRQQVSDDETIEGWSFFPTSFDVLVRDDPKEVIDFVHALPQRTVEFPVKRRSLSEEAIKSLQGINHVLFRASEWGDYDLYYYLSAEENLEALMEFKLRT